MIDYKNLIQGLQPDKIKQLLFKLGAEDVVEKENCFITNTICHNDSSGSLKLYYYFDTHLFVCYTDCGAMNIFKFLQTYYENRQIEFNWYTDILNVVEQCSEGGINFDIPLNVYERISENYKRKKPQPLNILNNKIMDVFIDYYTPEWINDNISIDSMKKFNIKYSISQNKIIIPHYDVNNNLIGIRGRALNEWEIENVGKYTPVQIENVWYSHPLSLNLYGLNINKDSIKKSGICYIFESEKSVMQCDTFGVHNSVAICGSSLNKFQIQLLMKECMPNEIIICLDNEEKDGEDKYFNKLKKMCEKYKNYANFSFVYDFNNITKKKDSPSDNGKEIFTKLLKERVRIK